MEAPKPGFCVSHCSATPKYPFLKQKKPTAFDSHDDLVNGKEFYSPKQASFSKTSHKSYLCCRATIRMLMERNKSVN